MDICGREITWCERGDRRREEKRDERKGKMLERCCDDEGNDEDAMQLCVRVTDGLSSNRDENYCYDEHPE